MIENIQDTLDKAVSDRKLSDIDIDYYYESIESQLDSLLSVSSKKNYLKKFENRINESTELYDDELETAKDLMYNNVIDLIANKFEFDIDKSGSLMPIAKNLYKFFVLDYTNNLTFFLESYILENKKDIVKQLETEPASQGRITGIDSKISVILNNIAGAIDIIAADEIDFGEFIDYVYMHPEASAAVAEVREYNNDILSNTDNAVKMMLSDLVNEEEGFGKIYTDLQLNIFNRFKSPDM